MGLGALFLLAFAGGLADLYGLRRVLVTDTGSTSGCAGLKIGVTGMAVVAWLTVIAGAWVAYPWSRDPAETSPQSQLLAVPSTTDWHEFGMEWKEHVAWLSPILANAVAFVVLYYGDQLIRHQRVRRTAIALFVLAFAFAAATGVFGAFITRSNPSSRRRTS